MPRIACILNPKARDGLSIKQWEKFEPALEEAGFEVDLYRTKEPGHAMDIARDLWESDHDLVVAVGGDGTVHEVASGLRGSKKILGILPIGSGNDYARAHGIPTPKGNKFRDMQGSVDILDNGPDRRVQRLDPLEIRFARAFRRQAPAPNRFAEAGDAAGVESPHGQLSLRFTDALGGDDAYRLSHVY